MAAVYVNNLVVNSGTDFNQIFTLESAESNSALDLTSYTAEAEMRKWSGSLTSVPFTVSILAPTNEGRISIALTSGQTTNLKPGRYVYDVVITDTYLKKTRVIEGMVLVREGVTK